MFKYKDIQFYNEYCKSLKDFTLLEAFTEEDNDFVGKVMPNDTLYPIEIYVHIPQTFPHNKLTFRTRSVSGYPHLIPFYKSPELGSWFCLNTAFAETTEEQLDEEFNRLREWMQRQLRPELPQHITDDKTRSALRVFNIYEGENPDELNEITEKGNFTFLGDFGKDPKNFQESGFLNAVRYNNQKFTIVEDAAISNCKLPYVIVNNLPKNVYYLSSWIEECKWSDELCCHLLPDFEWGKNVISSQQLERRVYKEFSFEPLTDEEAIEHLAYLKNKMGETEMPETHKEALKKELDGFLEYEKRHREDMNKPIDDIDDGPYEPDPSDLYYNYIYKLHYFSIGHVVENEIKWYLVKTNRNSRQEKSFFYDLGMYIFKVKSVFDIHLFSFTPTQYIEKDSYFGRGKLCEALCSKKIALIGLGAIGSPLAESLVRGGVTDLSLWDGDIVEAGNICRSKYNQSNIGNSKVFALKEHLQKISPFVKITSNGYWKSEDYSGVYDYKGGEFYGNINYNSQEKFITSLKEYDLIIDCTASNELLHFLSYAAKNVDVLSLCITNQSRDMLCLSNRNGNLFELRKYYLASIEQETGNFYSEGTGCYSPTFLATYCDIQVLTNLCVRTINRELQSKGQIDSKIWHYNGNGVIADNILIYRLENSPITMTIPKSLIEDIKHLPMLRNGENGYLFGGYNTKRTSIYVTNVISRIDAQKQIDAIQIVSKGIIDYLGNICVTSENFYVPKHCQKELESMVQNKSIDTKNPLLATLAPNGDISFMLYIGEEFVPFHSIN